MEGKRTAQEKILSVLELIKDQSDLSPRGPRRTDYGVVRHYGRSREIKIHSQDFYNDCQLKHYELESILNKLREEGLLEGFKFIPDYM